jgi:NAD-dependent deacetylase
LFIILNVFIITQNVDGLHTKAGSTNVIEFHGTINKNSCLSCGKEYDADFVFSANGVPKCECGGIVKPKVTLYGEMPEHIKEAQRYVHRADVLVAIGSSLLVSPANTYIYDALYYGTPVVIINKESTPFDRYATVLINDDFRNIFKETK